jgi:hypothetical protein
VTKGHITYDCYNYSFFVAVLYLKGEEAYEKIKQLVQGDVGLSGYGRMCIIDY